MEKISQKEIINQVAAITEFRKADIKACLDAYYVVVAKNIESLNKIPIGGVGTIQYTKVPARKELHDVILNPSHPEIKGTKPATEAFYRVTLKPTASLKEKVKEKSYGHVR